MKKIIIPLILLIISAFFIVRTFTVEIDEYGTKETDLVKAAGKNICMSCIGLYDENIFAKIKEKFSGNKSEESK
ncbi:hypothetical protein IJG44_05180 [bacterium]|nr:hypothetical protein [bacterium]MBQ4437863.1 hypothetical protein [bacterium]